MKKVKAFLKATSVSKISIRPRGKLGDKISTGANTVVLLNGKMVKGCHRVQLDIEAGVLAKVTMELYAQVDAKVVARLNESNLQPVPGSKRFAKYELSSHVPIESKKMKTYKV